jgi:hypothetical protein
METTESWMVEENRILHPRKGRLVLSSIETRPI